ncbi:1-(5-phosphoribosyl)-5-[(5-phosphoribosylamino)methylideneamino]imidazole-4-carboxamide isomerase [Enterobacteriaceae endosymbiont of Plateumaris consimilis]|uniref:1-(5-phosphoribosyl)-5-[(5- phosphoribosylamino)methylideneamino]imidazole-4- carboxamide isomerase n=1 Tax=Enterobacteriaceae endosymbiont of Plateumaris consimilis TaxID=2675794 RepID=UPI001449B3F5|nr:1-(5-phosphoribosyl)-5-[(5-phosphoribosylamino)methylideneamino]imidazole-4-carboxamide isomerase [Enterobacteriaceae endosymbiont of Plateumaris consimilis]QJC28536.1 1-(5-phosphoribosyl)-5-[(5-phosphoribosylamino)methylideneamino]imidazole-4-carboxamide isomerase [Enterobacteriaceae endosymbiont of Plateumaris consimilis]
MIIPAIDLIRGKVVRLLQGKFNSKHEYCFDPLFYINKYINSGAKKIHIVDLDGAKNPKKKQINLFKEILTNIKIPLQIGGGIRKQKDIDFLFNLTSISQIIIGSSAIQNFEIVKKWFQIYNPNKIILAFDIKIDTNKRKILFTNGWQNNSDINLETIMKKFIDIGLKNVLCTDISKDGTLLGPNIELYSDITQKYPEISFQASGGIHSLNDIKNLKNNGVKDIIIGKAFLENKFTFKEANLCWQKELFHV